jgi:hypothetical protein
MVTRMAIIEDKEDDLSKPPTKLPINLKAGKYMYEYIFIYLNFHIL